MKIIDYRVIPFPTAYEVVHATNVFDLDSWTNRARTLPPGRGTNTVTVTNPAERDFYRVRPVP